MGGTPVYRDKSRNLVEAVADTFSRHERLHIGMAPEGTRENVSELKTGFYYMAQKANVPLILVGWGVDQKTMFISEPFYVTGNYEADLAKMAPFFLQVTSRQKDWIKKYE